MNMRLATVAFASGFVGAIAGGQLYNRTRKEVRPKLEKLEIQANYMEKFEAAPGHALWSMINTQLQQQSFRTGHAVHLKLPFSTGDSLQAVKNATVMMSDKVAIQTATISYTPSRLLDSTSSTVDRYLNTHVWGCCPSWGSEMNFTDLLPDVPVFLFITDEENMFLDENLPVLDRVCANTQLAIVVITYEN